MASQTSLTNLQYLCIKLVKGSVGKRYLVCLLIFKRQNSVLGSQLHKQTPPCFTDITQIFRHSCAVLLQVIVGEKEKGTLPPRGEGKFSWQKPGHGAGLSRDGHIHVTARWEMLSRFVLHNYREERVSL